MTVCEILILSFGRNSIVVLGKFNYWPYIQFAVKKNSFVVHLVQQKSTASCSLGWAEDIIVDIVVTEFILPVSRSN